MTDLTTLDAAELAGKIHSREVSSVEVTQAHLDRIAAVDTEYHAFLHVAGRTGSRSRRSSGQLARRRKRTRFGTRRRSDRVEGHLHHDGHADHLCVENSRRLGCTVRRDSDVQAARCRHPDPRQDEPRRVRDGLLDGETPPSARRVTRGTSPASPAVRAAVAQRRSRPVRPRSPSALTPAVRSVSPLRLPRRSEPSRRTELSHASGSSRAPPRSIRAVPVVAPCSTPLYCTRSSPGTIRVTPRPSTPPCVRWSLRHVKVQPATCAASKSVWSRNFTPTATSPASSLPSTLPSSNSRLWVPKLSRFRARASSMRSRRTTWCCPARSRPTWLASTPCATDCVSTTAT